MRRPLHAAHTKQGDDFSGPRRDSEREQVMRRITRWVRLPQSEFRSSHPGPVTLPSAVTRDEAVLLLRGRVAEVVTGFEVGDEPGA